MLAKWPIRNKLLVGIALLLVIVSGLALNSLTAIYAYRGLVKSVRGRASELPLATALGQRVSDLRAMLSEALARPDSAENRAELQRDFRDKFNAVLQKLAEYRKQLLTNENDDDNTRIRDSQYERDVVVEIDDSLLRIARLTKAATWSDDEVLKQGLRSEVDELQTLAADLPAHLHERLHNLASDVRSQYRTMIAMNWITGTAATALIGLLIHLFYRWIFRPLRVLVKGSRRVAGGDFSHRIQLDTDDEMSELADAMNGMTARFQAIRDDLDRQVQLRTKQVIRGEQLASVGFLAAGVAHEINNPLASIAMCAESLESRLNESSPAAGEQQSVVRTYLKMIQSEAFRCKEITEKLLDFSRLGESRHQTADLNEVVRGVVEMVHHLGKYKGKKLEFQPGPAIFASINAQEIKQVLLNLIVNGLDSVADDGRVNIEVRRNGEAELIVSDDGCGMSDEVREHLFEPFFTRKRSGQGTGLGLSIAYRIIADHQGRIEATSEGPGRGAQFRVTFPSVRATQEQKELSHRHQAA